MDGIAYPTVIPDSDQDALKRARRQREESLKRRAIKGKLAEETMSEREIEDAIRVMERRLKVLKKKPVRKKKDGVQ